MIGGMLLIIGRALASPTSGDDGRHVYVFILGRCLKHRGASLSKEQKSSRACDTRVGVK